MDECINKKLLVHVWIVCALGLFIDGYDLYISSVAEPFVNQIFHPTPFMIGLTQAAAPLGAVFGALIIGRLSDLIGRKSLLIFNLFFFVFIALLSACAWNMITLCLFRFLIGFGVGADYPICAAYLAEMIPEKKNSQLIAAAMFINCIASPVGVFAAWMMFKAYPHIEVWRLMFASGALPAVIGLLLRAKLPESFIWRAQQRLKQSRKDLETAISSYKKIFSPELKKMTLCLGFSWFFQDISYYGIGLFTPAVLQALQLSHEGDFLLSANAVLKSALLVNLFVLLGAGSVIFFIEKINHLRLQKLGFIFAFFGLLLLSLSFTASYELNIFLIFSGFIIFNFFINFGPGTTTYLLPAKFYATDVRATGHGFASSMGKLGAFSGTIFLPLLQAWLGIYLTVFILSFTLLAGWLLTRILNNEELVNGILNKDINEPVLVST